MGDVVRLVDGRQPEQAAVEQVARVLAGGGVAVFPTDTVYGIAQTVAANPDGPHRLFAIKRRPAGKVVPWLVADPDDLDRYAAAVPAYARMLARAFWPGPLTLVLRARASVPPAYRAADGTVALRVPDSTFVRALVRAVGSPLATTSANTSGMPAPVCFGDVEGRIMYEADIIVDGGETLDGEASTVVVCTGDAPVVTREGVLDADDVARAIGTGA